MKITKTNAIFFNITNFISNISFDDKKPGFYLRLMNINEELSKAIGPFLTKRQELFQEYGEEAEETTEDGNKYLRVPQEKLEEFTQKMREYESEELTVNIQNPLRMSDVSGMSLSDLTPLKDFILFEE